MAKRRRKWNRSVFERYLKEGRGQGEGATYIPWVMIHDFPSRGNVSRVYGRKTGRIHHFMSNIELNYFYIQEWDTDVTDIREQYPLLELDCALECAEELEIRYPRDPKSGYPYVLSCDFMLTTTRSLKARTIKMSTDLEDPRVIEKLKIERLYWEKHNIDWMLITEKSFKSVMANNIKWLFSAENFTDSKLMLCAASAKNLMVGLFRDTDLSILDVAETVEREYLLDAGVGLVLFRQLVCSRELEIDLNKNIDLRTKNSEVLI